MNKRECHAIFLRKGEGGERLNLFTSEHGRIIVRERTAGMLDGIVVGTRLTVHLSESNGFFVLRDVVEEMPPSDWGLRPFYWLQHLLELYYYCTPLAQPNAQLYDLLEAILTLDFGETAGRRGERAPSPCEQRYFLLAFYRALGEHVPDPVVNAARKCIADDLLKKACPRDYHYTALIDNWLVWCISEQPYGKHLRTRSYFSHIYPNYRLVTS